MAERDNIHVLPYGSQWKVERGTEPVGVFDTQQEAVASGRREAQQTHVDLVVFGHDGQVHLREEHRGH